MKLETKLGLSSAVLILAMLMSAATAHQRVSDAARRAKHISTVRVPLLKDCYDLSNSLSDSIQALQANLLFGVNQSGAARFRAQRAEAMRSADRALRSIEDKESHFGSAEEMRQLSLARSELTSLRLLQESAEHLNDALAFNEVLAAYGQIFDLSAKLSKLIDDITERQQRQAEQETQRLDLANRRTLWTIWISVFVSCLVGGVFSTLLGRSITAAVDLVVARADAIAGGDLTGVALVLPRDDQIGSLATAMNRMQDSLGAVLGAVADTAGSLTLSVAQMRLVSTHVHQRADEQSQQTEQAAGAMQEMSASIAEVSQHTQSAAETARGAAQTARDGGLIVQEVLAAMHAISGSVAEAGAIVALLREDSFQISKIVTVIETIARNINLLALNAAIEAARAGDQGRGFAAVAVEVRRLAESTARATGEISTMIGGVQGRIRSMQDGVEAGGRIVGQGVLTTHQAGEALTRIIWMAEQVDRMIAQIAIAAAQQALGADQSSASLRAIHELAQEGVQEMADSAKGVEVLRSVARTLEQQVDRFQVDAA